MHCVNLFSEIEDGVREVRSSKSGFITNFFPEKERVSLWIDRRVFLKIKIGETIFFLKENEDFTMLYYLSTNHTALLDSLTALTKATPLVTYISDLVGKENILETKVLFENSGFQEYTYLVRMNRMIHEPERHYEKPENLKEAELHQTDELLNLFNSYFDPKAEQIPLKEEIIKWINLGSLLVYEVENQIAGFIIYDLNGTTLYLRYWFVHPEFRERKIGSHLFNYFLFKGKDTKRQLFWVINSNANAIKRYKHYGFSEERMYNYIMINKNLRYEG